MVTLRPRAATEACGFKFLSKHKVTRLQTAQKKKSNCVSNTRRKSTYLKRNLGNEVGEREREKNIWLSHCSPGDDGVQSMGLQFANETNTNCR